MGGKLGKIFTHVKQGFYFILFYFILVVKIMFIIVDFSLFGCFSMLIEFKVAKNHRPQLF